MLFKTEDLSAFDLLGTAKQLSTGWVIYGETIYNKNSYMNLWLNAPYS